ncbi:hypothetical protein ACFYMM_43560, partial [Streptomyces sp. NPDC006739]
DLDTARKVIAEVAPAGAEPDPPETGTAYQAIVNAFNQHPGQVLRAARRVGKGPLSRFQRGRSAGESA